MHIKSCEMCVSSENHEELDRLTKLFEEAFAIFKVNTTNEPIFPNASLGIYKNLTAKLYNCIWADFLLQYTVLLLSV